MKNHSLKTLAVAVLSALSGTALAAGFAVGEQSNSALGSAFAGSASQSENASNQWYNPATLTRLKGTQISASVNQVMIDTSFNDHNASTTGDIKNLNVTVPALYLSHSINPGLAFGLAINSPFGTTLEYSPNWGGDYYALKSTVKTVNVNPQIAYDLGSMVTVGVGLNYQTLDGDLKNAGSRLKGSDSGYGWNVGLLFEPVSGQKFGVAYRSEISYKLDGHLTVYPPSPGAGTYAATAGIDMPESTTVSWTGDVANRTQLMADVTRMNWSRLDNLVVHAQTIGTVIKPLGWTDSTRSSLGIRHELPGGTVLRAGYAYETSSQGSAQTRSALTPDADRQYLAIGATFKPQTNMSVDVGYAHVFVNQSTVNRQDAGLPPLQGVYDLSADIVGAQLNYKF